MHWLKNQYKYVAHEPEIAGVTRVTMGVYVLGVQTDELAVCKHWKPLVTPGFLFLI
jgi:hypothetical protein